MNESAFLKIMKNTINLDRPGVFCEKQPYDDRLRSVLRQLLELGDAMLIHFKYI